MDQEKIIIFHREVHEIDPDPVDKEWAPPVACPGDTLLSGFKTRIEDNGQLTAICDDAAYDSIGIVCTNMYLHRTPTQADYIGEVSK